MSKKKLKPQSVLVQEDNNKYFIGNTHIENALFNLIKTNNLPHAIIFTGPKSCGKTTFAYRFIRFLIAIDKDKSLLNNQDLTINDEDIFYTVVNKAHPDVMIVKAESNFITIDQVRKVNSFLKLTSGKLSRKIVLIDASDDLNLNSANSLLKTLEEPSGNSLIILINHNKEKILPTIKSRCYEMRFNPLNKEESFKVLKIILSEVENALINQLLELADYSPGIAVKIYQNDVIKYQDKLKNFLDKLPNISFSEMNNLAEAISEKGSFLWEIIPLIFDSFLRRYITIELDIRSDEKGNSFFEYIKNNFELSEVFVIREKIQELYDQTERSNLDKKQFFITVINILAKNIDINDRADDVLLYL